MEAIYRLAEIQGEIQELLYEAKDLIRENAKNSTTYERARIYWIAHIEGALSKNSEWLGGSMFTMEDTIIELEGMEEQEMKNRGCG